MCINVTNLQVCVPDTWWGQTIPKHHSLEHRKIYWGPCKEMNGSCPKNPQTPQKFSAKPFYRKGERGVWLVAAAFLLSDPLLVRSGCSGSPRWEARHKGAFPSLAPGCMLCWDRQQLWQSYSAFGWASWWALPPNQASNRQPATS